MRKSLDVVSLVAKSVIVTCLGVTLYVGAVLASEPDSVNQPTCEYSDSGVQHCYNHQSAPEDRKATSQINDFGAGAFGQAPPSCRYPNGKPKLVPKNCFPSDMVGKTV